VDFPLFKDTPSVASNLNAGNGLWPKWYQSNLLVLADFPELFCAFSRTDRILLLREGVVQVSQGGAIVSPFLQILPLFFFPVCRRGFFGVSFLRVRGRYGVPQIESHLFFFILFFSARPVIRLLLTFGTRRPFSKEAFCTLKTNGSLCPPAAPPQVSVLDLFRRMRTRSRSKELSQTSSNWLSFFSE